MGYKMDFINTQIDRVMQLDCLSLLKGNKERTSKKGYVNRMVLTLDFHRALLDVHKILQDLQVLVNMSPVLRKVFMEVLEDLRI